MAFLDMKTIEKKRIDSNCIMTVSENLTGERIFIEFSTNDGSLRLEKSFSSSGLGKHNADLFRKQIKSTKDLRNYFGINNRRKNVATKDSAGD